MARSCAPRRRGHREQRRRRRAPIVDAATERRAHGAGHRGGFVIHGGRAGGEFGDVWRWVDDVWTELRCEGSTPAPRWSPAVALPGRHCSRAAARAAGDLEDAHVLDLATQTRPRCGAAFPVAFAVPRPRADNRLAAAARRFADAAWATSRSTTRPRRRRGASRPACARRARASSSSRAASPRTRARSVASRCFALTACSCVAERRST